MREIIKCDFTPANVLNNTFPCGRIEDEGRGGIMNTKKRLVRKTLSILLAALMIMGAAFAGSVSVSAAASTVRVRIANVKRMYRDAKSYLDMINQYRVTNGRSPLTMDKTYLENAMIRAAEISLFASGQTPAGNSGSSYATGATDGAEIISIDMPGLNYAFDNMKNSDSSLLLKGNFKSAGVGIVSVNGRKFFSVLLSSKAPVEAPSETYSQGTVTVSQEVETLYSYLSGISPAYSDGQSVYCGSSLAANVKVKNKGYPVHTVAIESYNTTVNLSDSSVFEYQNGRVYARSPGSCTMTITINGSSDLSARVMLKAVGKPFSECTFATIPDQVYTGKPITPTVKVTTYDGDVLVNSVDYEVTYENNIKVGTATAHIKGKGAYIGESKDIHFNIVSPGGSQDTFFGVSVKLSKSTVSLGESIKVTAVTTGGTYPVKFTYSYAPKGSSNWKTITSDTTSNSCLFTPPAATTYNVRISAKDYMGKSASKTEELMVTPRLNASLEISSYNSITGKKLTLTAGKTGGTDPVKYQFSVKKPGDSGFTVFRKDSTDNKTTYTPNLVGIYQFKVTVTSATDETANLVKTVKVSSSALANKSTVSKTELDLGTKLVISAAATGGKTPYTYAYVYRKPNETTYKVLKGYSTQTSYTFTPTVSGTYGIGVKVKDSAGNVSSKFFSVKVYSTLKNNSRVSTTKTLPGKSITITGSASGGKSGYQYAYFYKPAKATSFTLIKSYSTTTSTKFTLYNRGDYTIRVRVKDQTGNTVSKDFNVSFESTMTNNSTVTPISISGSGTVTTKFAAKGGTAPYKFTLSYKAPDSSSYTSLGSFTAGSQKTFKVSKKGTWIFKVKVMDAQGAIIAKSVAVKVT